MRSRLFATAALCVAALSTTPAMAADVGNGFSVTGGATIVTDYRFRGISLSDEDPAIQGTLNLNHSSGFYAGVWGSSLDDTPTYGEVELDLYAGWRGEIASGTTFDVGLLYYYYPFGDGPAGPSDYFEPYTSITHNFGPVTGKIGAAYAWDQSATGGGDNVFVYTDWTVPIPDSPVSLRAHLGYSDGTLSPTGDYLEWAIGADFTHGPLTLGVSYVDTDLGGGENVDAGVLVSLGVTF